MTSNLSHPNVTLLFTKLQHRLANEQALPPHRLAELKRRPLPTNVAAPRRSAPAPRSVVLFRGVLKKSLSPYMEY